MKKFYFLSGLPRSGSTLLTAILNQNPKFYASPTSGLIDIMGSTLTSWYNKVNEVQGRDENELFRLLTGVMNSKYEKIDKPIIFDKSRGWTNPEIIRTMSKVLGEQMKIIATVRNVSDCASSFVRIVNPEDKKKFIVESPLLSHLRASYVSLHSGFLNYPESILFVDYDDLVNNPKKELDRIHKFLNLDDFEYDFENVDGKIVKERDDEVWDIPNLHSIQPKVERQHNISSKDVLGSFYEDFNQEMFWNKSKSISRKPSLLQEQLELALKGKFEQSYDIVKQLEEEEPENDRAAFNRGWFYLRNGKLLEGHKLLDRGRILGVFGNKKPNTDKPIWDGKSKGVVLLQLEGGLGDQIFGLRYCKDIVERGCSVVVCCSKELFPILKNNKFVSALIQRGNAYAVYHDFWLPSMSAIVPLEYEYSDILGDSYIEKPIVKKENKKIRVGLRWQGNPEFEHEQYRKFPAGLLFDSVKNDNIEFVSLQKDIATELKPDWVKEVDLESWDKTQNEIAKCDLIISSCTSVAHLSAAMGIPTWIIVPILPYYIWSLPQNTSPFYNSVKLYRQEIYGNWAEPFNKINQDLSAMFGKETELEYLSV